MGSALVTSGHNPGPLLCTPSVADTRFCYKVPSYCKVSSGLKSGGSCGSGKVLETHHMLEKKGKKEKEQCFTYAAVLQAEGKVTSEGAGTRSETLRKINGGELGNTPRAEKLLPYGSCHIACMKPFSKRPCSASSILKLHPLGFVPNRFCM